MCLRESEKGEWRMENGEREWRETQREIHNERYKKIDTQREREREGQPTSMVMVCGKQATFLINVLRSLEVRYKFILLYS